MRRALLLVISLLLIVLVTRQSDGRPPIRKAFFRVYPSAELTRLDDLPSNPSHCGVCHLDFDGGGPRNPYGLAVEVARASGMYASDDDAILSVEGFDSDNDGYLNVVEITDTNFTNTPTFPGLTAGSVGAVTNVLITEIQDYLTPMGSTDTIPPTVTLTYPNGGEVFDADSVVTVMWSASDANGIDRVDIFMSDDNGMTFKPIAVRESDDGMFDWFVHNLPGATILRVMARDGAGNWGSDWSDAPFTIAAKPAGIVPTTLRDMHLTGSQPLTVAPVDNPGVTCITCHGNYNDAIEPWYQWQGSMMAQAMRDPLFLACLAVAEQDAPSVGDLCLRCHTPGGWLGGRSTDTSGGLVTTTDRQGVQCDFCHRLVDPIYQMGVNPIQDEAILDSLDVIPLARANGQYVMDPDPIRRGPYADAQASHAFVESPFHRAADECGTCHDVSNPVFNAGLTPGDYVPNAFDTEHGDMDLRNMFPIERTYSEWSQSEYATTGVYAPQFVGNKPDGIASTCQDCHMKDLSGKGCNVSGAPTRTDLPHHDMTGGNTCVGDMVAMMFPGEVDAMMIADGKARATAMLQMAASLALATGQDGLHPTLTVTVTNEGAHKLPSGYPEGRRIWINVKTYDAAMNPLSESGHYDPSTGVLDHDGDLKIYHIEPGLSTSLGSLLGLTPGQSFHFVINDTVYFDNRIPPRGFTNAGFEAIQSPPVGYGYPDGQYWDETLYTLPIGATFAEVTLYYQTTSKEYVEFLQSENVTNAAGDDLYNMWVATGKCPPVAMVSDTISLTVDPTGVSPPTAATRLLNSAPNPFSGGTSIKYSLAGRQPVEIAIYDVAGRLVQTLVNEIRPEGAQSAWWDGTNHFGVRVASGVYYYRMTSGNYRMTRKIVLVR